MQTEAELDGIGGSGAGGTAVATGGEYSDQIKEIGDRLANLQGFDARLLGEYLESEYDIPYPQDAEGPLLTDAEAGVEPVVEKSTFDVILAAFGDKKINIIKVVRTLTGLGIKESKDLVEAAPQVVKADVPKDEAEKMKAAIEAEGGKVELK
jgi:large subunit ribosomal protein L7/L12